MKNDHQKHSNRDEDNGDQYVDDYGFGLPLESEFIFITYSHLIKKINLKELKDLFMHVVMSHQQMRKLYHEILRDHDIQVKEYREHIETSYLSGKVEDFYTELDLEKAKADEETKK